MSELDNVRKKINNIDKEMASLFEERMNLAKEVAEYKMKFALPIFDAKREKEVIERNSQYISDDSIKEYYVRFLQNLMDESKNYQSRLIDGLKVAYSGVEGAFAHAAAIKMFPNSKYIAYPDFESAYKAVENGEVDTCILPLENSYNGDVGLVMDLMFSGNLYINQVIELDVNQNLVAVKGAKKEDIKTVISHPQALAQCSKYIHDNKYEQIEANNTAVAAKLVSEKNDKTLAAIANSITAEIYNLDILEKNINSSPNNTTRFGAFSRSLHKTDKKVVMGQHFTLMFTVKNEAGSLAKTLNIIGSYGFNMRSLRSRPMKELMWNYYFYVELEGNPNSEAGQEMIKALGIFCDELKLVGTYLYNTEK